MAELVPRHALGFAERLLDAFPAVVVEGARQVGKSTLAAMLATGRDAQLFSLDDEQSRVAAQADPRSFVEQAAHGVMVIDELQRMPELVLAIKAAIDRDRRPGRFVLTGSSDLLRLRGTPDSLAGRAVTVRLRGFSQGELSGRADDVVSAWLVGSPPTGFTTSLGRPDYVAAIGRGGFPELSGVFGRVRTAWIDSYLARVLERDLASVPGGSQPARLRSVLALIAANQSGELVKARIAQHAGIPSQTITTYLDALSTVFLVDLLPPWTPNLTRREVGRSKAMVADPALAMRLNRLTEPQLASLTDGGALGPALEAFVVGELLKQQTWSGQDYQLFHYRDRNGLEVDVVVELDDGRVFGVEVKASATYKAEHFHGLRALRDALGGRFVGGFVLGTAREGYQYAERLWGMPVAALWEWAG
jgi:predicted AAA+ superfamily ATPase